MSHYTRAVCYFIRFKQKMATPYHPVCNGLVDRSNATLSTCLRCLCSENHGDRTVSSILSSLPAEKCGRSQKSNNFTPFEHFYHRTILGPMHILVELWTREI
ncbi:reverse transcriptase [Plakobranchus ocellatus]|uniref:Reverse transcriptase n=1 Tax=Plakobranchus ocellatus TaxID=259542 RepID=A0AAV4C119_9GAST|nr:reverse transcriptase [Plakobranchus ocellatus]